MRLFFFFFLQERVMVSNVHLNTINDWLAKIKVIDKLYIYKLLTLSVNFDKKKNIQF